MTSSDKLTTPDLSRCQAEIRDAHGPFVLGPPPSYERCKAKSIWIATEPPRKGGGVRGSMALCDSCKKVCEEKMPGASFDLIPEKRRTKKPSSAG